MKPKQIIVTEENFNWVYSRIKKFFRHRYMSYWHTFNCGNKKRIGKRIISRHYREKPCIIGEHYLIWPIDVSLDERFPGHIFLKWNYGTCNHSWNVRVGDTISFIGNRIIHKKKWLDDNEYIYYCFQIEGADNAIKNKYSYW